ncbi:GTP-binding protein [Oerskovia turbata]|uniref:GTP-binding protein n=1 Tax=Oerskovia turbata TaxID=1713 RepID=A0A4Q1KUV8_9CELL|nr:GTP-binding protein [Oerskovia turbata]RXR25437.1 GTP-binding protein [Oerskovia turbata]RXR33922.1 GTP-binding protein [Oerskovia turbata]
MPADIPGTPRTTGTGVPLSVLATIDPVLRDTAIFGLVTDSPRSVALRHDIHAEDGTLRRLVVDATGVVEDTLVDLEHACLSCAVREDAIPTLHELAHDGRWDEVLLALPVSAEPLPVVRALAAASRPGGGLDGLRLATVLTVVDLAAVETDLLDDDLLEERGLALTPTDHRSVGEVLAAQVEHADLVVTTGAPGLPVPPATPDGATHPGGHAAVRAAWDRRRASARTGSGLVDRLRADASTRVDGLERLCFADLSAASHDATVAERRAHPLGVRAVVGQDDGTGTWTLELVSDLPFDPERLLHQVRRLGTGRLRSRGVFWVPNRPDSMCAWDGAGGQLSIGAVGTWDDTAPRTRLVFTGAADSADDRTALVAAFDEILATREEVADGGLRWLGREDVLAPWLGDRSDAV